nr:phosphotransferase [Ruegeria arenilitoris]
MERADVSLVAERENTVYEVRLGTMRLALRVHRQSYRTDGELRSELEWMAAMAEAGLSVPAPVPTPKGEVLRHIDGFQVDVLTWLKGETMTSALPKLGVTERRQLFFELGREMARLHQASDAWDAQSGFIRVHWDRDGLVGDAPLWGRFWGNPSLTNADRAVFVKFRNHASVKLNRIGKSLDYGLVHADLVPDNILVDNGFLKMIDFDDGGYGYRLFDVATALFKHISDADYRMLRSRLFDGYRSIRPLDVSELDLFLSIRAATYVGWIITRVDEPGGLERNTRFIETFRRLVTKYLQHLE